MSDKNCATCRFHSTVNRPKVIGEAWEEIVEFDDETEVVYYCKHPKVKHEEIGTTPICCSDFQPPEIKNTSEVDALLARFEARNKK